VTASAALGKLQSVNMPMDHICTFPMLLQLMDNLKNLETISLFATPKILFLHNFAASDLSLHICQLYLPITIYNIDIQCAQYVLNVDFSMY
jgi:hypothetical protein